MEANQKKGMPETVLELVHKLRNTLSPLKTFLDVVIIPEENSKLVKFHQICRNNFEVAQEIINEIESK